MGFEYIELTAGLSRLPSGWRVTKVKEVAKVNELSIQKNYKHEWIEYIDIASVEKGAIILAQKLLLKNAPSRARRIVQDNDILLSSVRPNLEHYVFIKKAKQNMVASTGFSVITAKQAEPRFLYYYLTTKPFTNYLARIADSHTSAYPSFNPDVIENSELILPSEVEQKVIASILGALDDKIELNRKMNETLEAMARAIFKSWFVGFDPIPGIGPHKEWQDSPLGKIPKGWRVGTLSELCEKPQYGFTASAKDYPIGKKFLRITDINKQPWIDWTTVPYCEITPEQFEQYRVKTGDILIARMADPGHSMLIEEGADAVFASYLIRFRPIKLEYSRYLQYWLRSSEYWDLVNARSAGTTRVSLNAQVLGAFQLVVPSENVAVTFQNAIDTIRSKVNSNVKESNTLASIRDALLPKLLSGEIRVKEAERFVEVVI